MTSQVRDIITQLLSDIRVPYRTPLNQHQMRAGRLLSKYSSARAEDDLKPIASEYAAIKDLNDGLTQDDRSSLVTVLEEVRTHAQPYLGNRRVDELLGVLDRRIRQVHDGKYIWDFYLIPAYLLLELVSMPEDTVRKLSQVKSRLRLESGVV